jgi:hypothetical protein
MATSYTWSFPQFDTTNSDGKLIVKALKSNHESQH